VRPRGGGTHAGSRAASNAEIVRHLVLAEAIVKAHVSAVEHKLGVRDRVQAVVMAYDFGSARSRLSV
jgi:DNA-binding NarL/FixJ family response regulator